MLTLRKLKKHAKESEHIKRPFVLFMTGDMHFRTQSHSLLELSVTGAPFSIVRAFCA